MLRGPWLLFGPLHGMSALWHFCAQHFYLLRMLCLCTHLCVSVVHYLSAPVREQRGMPEGGDHGADSPSLECPNRLCPPLLCAIIFKNIFKK